MADERTAPRSIAIMQPYFLPYLGYFALIERSDVFVLMDTVQYARGARGRYLNRNRIRSQSDPGWMYITVPITKAKLQTAIAEIQVSYAERWVERLLRTVERVYGRAPHFRSVLPLLDPLRSRPAQLVDLIQPLLVGFSRHIGLPARFTRLSEVMQAHPELARRRRQDLLIGVCQALGASRYWNLPRGRALYSADAFAAAGVELAFIPDLPEKELSERFAQASRLSILDLAMHHSPAELREMIAITLQSTGP